MYNRYITPCFSFFKEDHFEISAPYHFGCIPCLFSRGLFADEFCSCIPGPGRTFRKAWIRRGPEVPGRFGGLRGRFPRKASPDGERPRRHHQDRGHGGLLQVAQRHKPLNGRILYLERDRRLDRLPRCRQPVHHQCGVHRRHLSGKTPAGGETLREQHLRG